MANLGGETRIDPVIVVGAGFAGLAAACQLAKYHIPVTVLEASMRAGGRVQSSNSGPYPLEVGQDFILGSHHPIVSLLNSIGFTSADLFSQQPFGFQVASSAMSYALKLSRLAPPLNLVVGFITAKGLGEREKREALKFCRGLNSIRFEIPNDMSVAELLKSFNQSYVTITHLWEPITLALLCTPIKIASATVWLTVLKKSI